MASASGNKAYLLTEDSTNIPCLFNPGELALHQANGWAADIVPGKGVPTLRYTGAASGQLHLNLFFDTTDTGTSVTTYTSKLVALMDVDTSLPGTSATTNNARPPWVVFHWGDFHSFKAVISKLELTFDYFATDGTPLRAHADLILTQYQEDAAFGPQNPTSGTPHPHRVHQVQPGETLDRIAAMRLGDPNKWREIADANGIEDPLSLRPGSLLAIPRSALMSIAIAPVVSVNGQTLTDTAGGASGLIEIRIELQLQVPGRCTLRFSDPGYTIASSSSYALATAVKVADPGGTGLFSGEVTSVAVEQRVGEHPELVVVCHDKSHRLGRESKVKTYQEMAYSDIVSSLVGSAGLTIGNVGTTSSSYPWVIQTDSDLGFLTELAKRVGYDWWVDDGSFYFQAPASSDATTLTLGPDLLAFSVKASGQHPDSVSVMGWDPDQQQSLTGMAQGATTSATSDLADLASTSSSLGEAEVITAAMNRTTQSELDQLSSALLGFAVAAAVNANGVAAGNAAIKLGGSVDVQGVGPLSGTYPVTKVEHIFRPRTGYVTRFSSGDRLPTSLVDTLAGGRARNVPATTYQGLMVARVSSTKDPNAAGRVQLSYPGLSGTVTSSWGRVLNPFAGSAWGASFIPEVGSEVLVGFEGGDLSQPVVIGGLYSSQNAMPYKEIDDGTGAVNTRGLKSRSGHQIMFNDDSDPSNSAILIETSGGKATIKLNDTNGLSITTSQVPITLSDGSSSLKLAGDGSITLTAGAKLTISAASIAISADSNIQLSADASFSLESTGSMSVQGASVSVASDGPLSMNGEPVSIN